MNVFGDRFCAVRCSLMFRYMLCLCSSWDRMGIWRALRASLKPPLPATRPESAQVRAQAPSLSANPLEKKAVVVMPTLMPVELCKAMGQQDAAWLHVGSRADRAHRCSMGWRCNLRWRGASALACFLEARVVGCGAQCRQLRGATRGAWSGSRAMQLLSSAAEACCLPSTRAPPYPPWREVLIVRRRGVWMRMSMGMRAMDV
jgi:hypothetical protein